VSQYVIMALFAAACGAWWWSYISSVRERRRRVGQWRELAQTHAGMFHAPSSWIAGPGSADLVIEQSVVHLELCKRHQGRMRQFFTRARATYACGTGPSFKIYPHDGLRESGATLLGRKLATLGDEAFDARFSVECDDEVSLRRAWTPRGLERMLDSEMSVVSDGREVRVERHGILGSGALDLAEIAGELASFGARDLAPYATLPDVDLCGPSIDPRRAFRCVIHSKAGEIEVLPRLRPEQPALTLRLAHERALPSLVGLVLEPATVLPDALCMGEHTGQMPAPTGAALTNTVASSGNSLSLEWPERPDPSDVANAVQWLSGIVVPTSSGAFR